MATSPIDLSDTAALQPLARLLAAVRQEACGRPHEENGAYLPRRAARALPRHTPPSRHGGYRRRRRRPRLGELPRPAAEPHRLSALPTRRPSASPLLRQAPPGHRPVRRCRASRPQHRVAPGKLRGDERLGLCRGAGGRPAGAAAGRRCGPRCVSTCAGALEAVGRGRTDGTSHGRTRRTCGYCCGTTPTPPTRTGCSDQRGKPPSPPSGMTWRWREHGCWGAMPATSCHAEAIGTGRFRNSRASWCRRLTPTVRSASSRTCRPEIGTGSSLLSSRSAAACSGRREAARGGSRPPPARQRQLAPGRVPHPRSGRASRPCPVGEGAALSAIAGSVADHC